MPRRWWIPLSLLLALVALGLVARVRLASRAPEPAASGATARADAEPGATHPHGAGATHPHSASASPAADPSSEEVPAALPPSLRGTEVDGALRVDAEGHFVPGPDALLVFDYFLSASGEEPDEVIVARIRRHVQETLDPPADAEALALLDTYLRYRERMRELATQGPVPEELERRLQWIREERRAVFGAALAETLFGEEEQVVRLDLERRAALLDPELDAAEKARRLADIEARLPAHVREARQRVQAPARVQEEVAALRAAGASDAEVFAVRERAFGAEAAERLAALDREQAAWQARLDAYADARDAILASQALDEAERAARIEALRAERFSEPEQVRVRALDAARAGVPSAAVPASED